MNAQRQRAVFLDRDGTINIEKEYLHRPEDFDFIANAPAAIRQLKDAGFLVIVVTNQSGVARGFYWRAAVCRLHEHLQLELHKFGTRIDGFYICPHHPTAGTGDYRAACTCRKGAPGMLLQAASDHNIDLGRSFMVGDKLADIEAGQAAGCRALLVRTGYGTTDEPQVAARFPGTKVFNNLADAAAYILAGQ